MDHPTQEALLRFILCAASRQENRLVVTHLLAGCPACAATLRQLRKEPPLSPPPSPEAYDQAFDRAAAFLGELLSRVEPPGRPEPGGAEGDLWRSSGISGNAARRRWLFG